MTNALACFNIAPMNTAVIKFSGKALGAHEELNKLFKSLRGTRSVIVHGGGTEVDALFKALSLQVLKKNGLRVSPKEQMPYICAALGGQCNKALQSQALNAGLNALGLMASDGGTLKVRQLDPSLGMVGSVSAGDIHFLNMLLDAGMIPVICSLCADEKGEIYNVNADDVASALASMLKCPLYFVSDVCGVLDGEKKLIPSLSSKECNALVKAGVITEGMAVKVKSAFDAAAVTHAPVYIGSVFDPDLSDAISMRRRLGTAVI